MSQSLSNASLAAALEKTINLALRYDPGTRAKLAKLEGCSIKIEITAPQLNFVLVLNETDITVLSHTEYTPDCALRGDLISMLSLLGRNTQTLANSGVEIIGNSHLLAKTIDIFKDLDIDWEEPLSDTLGDIAGPSIANKLKDGASWLTKRAQTLPPYIGDLITEELKLVPSKTELNNFSLEVNKLRSDSERAIAKLEKLKSHFITPAESPAD